MKCNGRLALLLSAVLLAPLASWAQEKPAAPAEAAKPAEPAKPEEPWAFTANAGLSTEYLFRGISQTNRQLAFSGGFDLTHSSGFYLGNWNSNISWLSDAYSRNPALDPNGSGLSAPLEVDIYSGYKWKATDTWLFDFGALYYYYPTSGLSLPTNPNSLELYIGVVLADIVSLKHSRSVTNLFGYADSKGSSYTDLSVNFGVGGGVTLTPHIGRQDVQGDANKSCSYTDYSLKGAVDLTDNWVLSGLIGGTNASRVCYTGPVGNNYLGRKTFVLSFSRSF